MKRIERRAGITVLSGVVGLAACGGNTIANPSAGDADSHLAEAGLAEVGTAPNGMLDAAADALCDDDAGSSQPAPVPLAPNTSCSATTEAIAAWSLGGTAPADYQLGFDTSMTCNGTPSLHLGSSTATGQLFGEAGIARTASSLAQHRVRLSGWILAKTVTGWAGLWMRVDTVQQTGVAFDNMQCRAISGTTGWLQYEVVLDVEADASSVAYGILLADQGDVWLAGVRFDVVDACVPTTGCP